MAINETKNLFTEMTVEEAATVNGGCYYSSSYYYKPYSYGYSRCGYGYGSGYGYKKTSYYGGYKGYSRYCY